MKKGTIRSKSTFAFGSSTERDLSYIKDYPKELRCIGISTTNHELNKACGPKMTTDIRKIIRQARSMTPKSSKFFSYIFN
uniref:Uncharacterized protein n=1 Tax=Parastrongyloides trichosuri TaxID=131310 RepID=A0A0N4ZML2_PARTI